MKYNHKGWDVFHMYHVIVWDQKACNNAYLTYVHHVDCCVAIETLIQETGLWRNTFSRPDALHIHYFAHDTPCFSTFSHLTLFVFSVIYNTMFA